MQLRRLRMCRTIYFFCKEFTKISATHCQPRLPHAPSHARSLGNQGCVKLREDTLERSVWSVVPASYVLGKASIVPVSVQKTKKPQWTSTTDDRVRLHWALPWPQMMGKDRAARIVREEGADAAAMANYYERH